MIIHILPFLLALIKDWGERLLFCTGEYVDELGDSKWDDGIGESDRDFECGFVREYEGCLTPSNMLKVLRFGLGDGDFFA